MDKDISIIIRTNNEAKLLRECLNSCFAQKFNGTFEVIIVDNESTDKTLKISKEFPLKIINIKKSEFTYGRAINLGIKNSTGKFIVILSAHCVLGSLNWLNDIYSIMKKDKKIVGISGPSKGHPLADPFNYRRFNNLLDDDNFSNSNSMIRRSSWEVQQFDESVPFAEDKLWASSLRSKGYKIVTTNLAKVFHYHPLNWKKIFLYYYSIGKLNKGDSQFKRFLYIIYSFFLDLFKDFEYLLKKKKLTEIK